MPYPASEAWILAPEIRGIPNTYCEPRPSPLQRGGSGPFNRDWVGHGRKGFSDRGMIQRVGQEYRYVTRSDVVFLDFESHLQVCDGVGAKHQLKGVHAWNDAVLQVPGPVAS